MSLLPYSIATRPAQSVRHRKKAFRLGFLGEAVAAWVLRLKGYRIVEKRFRHPAGEIDLIARRGRSVIFVEVKTRQDQAEGLQSLTRHQENRIHNAAAHWQARRDPQRDFDVRFDLMVISPNTFPLHLKNAF